MIRPWASRLAQMKQARQAFAAARRRLAEDLVRQDDVVDDLNREVFQLAVEIGEDKDGASGR